jgi:hypothetical protein
MEDRVFVIDADGHRIDRDGDYRGRLPGEYGQRLAFFPSDAYDRGQNGTINMVSEAVKRKIFSDNPRRFYGHSFDGA